MPSLDLALRLRPYGDASIAYRVTGETVRRGHASFSDPPAIPPNHPRYSTIWNAPTEVVHQLGYDYPVFRRTKRWQANEKSPKILC
jgi:hypothetical protein